MIVSKDAKDLVVSLSNGCFFWLVNGDPNYSLTGMILHVGGRFLIFGSILHQKTRCKWG